MLREAASAPLRDRQSTHRVSLQLQAMPEILSQRATEQLQKLGVDVRLDAKVTAIDANGVQVQPASPARAYTIDTRCVI